MPCAQGRPIVLTPNLISSAHFFITCFFAFLFNIILKYIPLSPLVSYFQNFRLKFHAILPLPYMLHVQPILWSVTTFCVPYILWSRHYVNSEARYLLHPKYTVTLVLIRTLTVSYGHYYFLLLSTMLLSATFIVTFYLISTLLRPVSKANFSSFSYAHCYFLSLKPAVTSCLLSPLLLPVS